MDTDNNNNLNIVLIGMMGSGKTYIGNKLAKLLVHFNYIDTDNVIENKTNLTINEIFEQHGEAYFRELESNAIKEISKNRNQIISLGGGAFENQTNITELRKNSLIFYLKASTTELFNRINNENGELNRPKLKDDFTVKTIENLLKTRDKNYLKANFVIDTTQKPAYTILDAILKEYDTYVKQKLFVEVSPNKTYPIFIDFEEIKTLEQKVFDYTKANKLLIVISEKVEMLYGKELNFPKSIKFVLKDGEKQKNFKNYKKIINFALKNKLERKDAIIAIGGGVVGDIAGFVAATYLRGIDFIQIPTTLLACVDSSVGGKVAINTEFGKNLVGAFYQPNVVFCNLNFLKTLDDRQIKTGLGEILKYAFIEGSCGTNYNLFEFLLNNVDKIKTRDNDILAEIVKMSLDIKASVVSKDEKEQGLRKVLNFGHTYGHTIENITNYKKFTHGEAVAIGMIFAINLAFKKGMITEEYKNDGLELIEKYNLVEKMPKFEEKRLVDLMLSDKKVEDGKIKFILPSSKSFVECINIDSNQIFN